MTYLPLRSIGKSRELFSAPIIASAFDDEFNTQALRSKWTQEGTLSGTAPAYGASFASAEIRQSVGQVRPSWIAMQNSSDGTRRGISQLIGSPTLPTGLYWTRLMTTWRAAGGVAGDNSARFGLYGSSGGNVDFAEGMEVNVANQSGGGSVIVNSVVQGGGTGSGAATADIRSLSYRWPYLALLFSAPTTARLYLGSPGGEWQFFASMTYSGGVTLDRVALSQSNTSSSTPGNSLIQWDFFRYSPVLDLP